MRATVAPLRRCTPDRWAEEEGEGGNSAKGPVFSGRVIPLHPDSNDARGVNGGRRGLVAHMPEKRERHDKLDLMTVAKKRDMKVGRAGRTDRN